MSAIAWLTREETVALGWTLLHFCWQGTAVAVAYAVVDQVTSRATSKVRYAVALAALMLMPAVVIGTFAMEMRAAAPHQANGYATQTVLGLHPVANPRPVLHELPLASSLEEPTDWLAMRAERLLPWVDALWMAGVFLLAIRSLGGWWQLELVRRRALRMVPQEVERGFQRISRQIQVGRRVVLRVSDQVISPLAMGVWQATVILPMSASPWTVKRRVGSRNGARIGPHPSMGLCVEPVADSGGERALLSSRCVVVEPDSPRTARGVL